MVFAFEELFDLLETSLALSIGLLKISIIMLIMLFTMLSTFVILLWGLLKLVLRLVPRGDPKKINVAFFHPYCNAGGGGERVLWTAIKALQSKYPNVECYVYTGDVEVTPEEIMTNIRQRFNINLEKEPKFIFLQLRKCIEAKYYPLFTLLGQSLGSVFLGTEAISRFKPDVCIDSMGYAFIYPIFRFLGGCKVGSYTHYPTISTDMFDKVFERTPAHNNRAFIANSLLLSYFKLGYYNCFAFLYGLAGRCANVVMVNSSWTREHISTLWKCQDRIETVYPPCDTHMFCNLPIIDDDKKRTKSIVSIGQFRPEKNYPLQLRSFKRLLTLLDPSISATVKLVLIGGVRNTDDEERVTYLKGLATELGIYEKVEWKIDAPFLDLLLEIQNGTIGLHTMWNEHFGISVVECMAGGLIMVAHNSGGPKLDIVKPCHEQRTGFLASTEEEYANTLKNILELPVSEKDDIRKAARKNVSKFSQSVFEERFLSSIESFFDSDRTE